tara:strand:- start:340 stop:618 length:279 start_codon:yes stop_codon:yes gene_type:complete
MSEYSKSSVGPACSYQTLQHYNSHHSGMMNQVPMQMSSVDTQGVQLVPDYAAPGYDTLMHGGNSCSGYGSITAAYGANADRCSTKYLKRTCQ